MSLSTPRDNVNVTGFPGQYADLPGKILGHRLSVVLRGRR